MRLKVFETNTEHEAALPHEDYPNIVCWISGDNTVIYHKEEITIPKLIERGYAFRDTNTLSGDNAYIQIESDCPYSMEEIVDFDQYNYIWRESLPDDWSDDDIIAMYNGKTLSIPPRASLFWGLDFSNCKDFEITFNGGEYIAPDYPWASYKSDGVFAPCYTTQVRSGYTPNHSAEKIVVNFNGSYSSVLGVAFTYLIDTTELTISSNNAVGAHNWAGAFEACWELETLNFINVRMASGFFNNITNMCSGCLKLKKFPKGWSSEWDHANNTLTPGSRDGDRVLSVEKAFHNCHALEEIEPLLDFQYVTSGADTCFQGCDSLYHLRIKNLGISWDFSNNPLDKDSIEFILSNVKDYTGTSGHTLTFSDLTGVDTSIIASAEAKGWAVS